MAGQLVASVLARSGRPKRHGAAAFVRRNRSAAGEMRAIRADELTHVRKHDFVWNLVASPTSPLRRLRPLAWRIQAAMLRLATPLAARVEKRVIHARLDLQTCCNSL